MSERKATRVLPSSSAAGLRRAAHPGGGEVGPRETGRPPVGRSPAPGATES